MTVRFIAGEQHVVYTKSIGQMPAIVKFGKAFGMDQKWAEALEKPEFSDKNRLQLKEVRVILYKLQ